MEVEEKWDSREQKKYGNNRRQEKVEEKIQKKRGWKREEEIWWEEDMKGRGRRRQSWRRRWSIKMDQRRKKITIEKKTWWQTWTSVNHWEVWFIGCLHFSFSLYLMINFFFHFIIVVYLLSWPLNISPYVRFLPLSFSTDTFQGNCWCMNTPRTIFK